MCVIQGIPSRQEVLSALANQTVYTDVAQPQTISGEITLTSVHVAGNVDVMAINSVDLKHLDASTVKTTGDFILQGGSRHPSQGLKGQLWATVLCLHRAVTVLTHEQIFH